MNLALMFSSQLPLLGSILIALGGGMSLYFSFTTEERALWVKALPWILVGVGLVLAVWHVALMLVVMTGVLAVWIVRWDRASEAKKRSYARYEIVATYEWADSQDRWHRIDVARVSDGFALGNVRAGKKGLKARPVFDTDVDRTYADPSLAETALREGSPVNYGVRVVQPITLVATRGP